MASEHNQRAAERRSSGMRNAAHSSPSEQPPLALLGAGQRKLGPIHAAHLQESARHNLFGTLERTPAVVRC